MNRRRRPRIAFVLALVCGGLASCSIFGLDSERRELEHQVAAWKALGIDSYEYEFERRCFCPPEDTTPVRIRVGDDQIVAINVVATGDSLPRSSRVRYGTVPQVFDNLARHLDWKNAVLSVRYDETYHYPAEARGDIKNAMDAAFVIYLRQLRPLR